MNMCSGLSLESGTAERSIDGRRVTATAKTPWIALWAVRRIPSQTVRPGIHRSGDSTSLNDGWMNTVLLQVALAVKVVVRSHFGSSRDPSPRLEFPLHLPSRQPHQHSFRVRFLFAVYIAWPLLLVALSSSGRNLVVPDRVRSLWWNMDAKLGGSQLRAEPVGRLSRGRTSHWQISSPSRVIRRRETTVGTSLLSRIDAAETRHLPCLDGQV